MVHYHQQALQFIIFVDVVGDVVCVCVSVHVCVRNCCHYKSCLKTCMKAFTEDCWPSPTQMILSLYFVFFLLLPLGQGL